MRKSHYALLALLLFAACRKYDLPVDNGCISRIARQNFMVKSNDSAVAVNLLKQNNIPYSDLQFEYINFDTVKNNSVTNIFQNVFAIQFINNLPVLSFDMGYTFKNGVFQQFSGKRYSGINLDTRSQQLLPRLRELYIAAVGKNTSSDNAAKLKDSCLVAEFGYYDLNGNVDNSTPNFVKAWSVSPKSAPYPQVFFRDDNGNMILYNGGFVLDAN
jgi:hypothetical protein